MTDRVSKHSTTRRARIFSHLDAYPVRSGIIIGLFVVYLPILYQLHLNFVARYVLVDAGGYFWATSGYALFPFPTCPQLGGLGGQSSLMWIVRLSPAEVYIYTSFYPSFAPRVMWSVLWLTIGITYIIWPLLSSSKTKENTVNISTG